MTDKIENSVEPKSLPCPHARPDWRMCPHCMGVPVDNFTPITNWPVEQLRALVKNVEWTQTEAGMYACRWCLATYDRAGGAVVAQHAPDCAAFTPDGQVK